MKRLIILIVVIFTSATTYAQLENQFYFRLGLSKPTLAYAGFDKIPNIIKITNRTGGVIELGNIFMLNSIPLGKNLAIGINTDYLEFTYHEFMGDDYIYNEKIKTKLYNIASKVGSSFSYSPVQDLVFDASFKFKINWFSALTEDKNFDFYGNETERFFNGFGGRGFATGLNVRFKFLMVGFEYNKIKNKLTNIDDNTEHYGNWESTLFNVSRTGTTTIQPAWNFMLGVSF